jgi:hypothetical protein
MPTDIELYASQIVAVPDLRKLNPQGVSKAASVAKKLPLLNSINESLAIDFSVHLLQSTTPDHSWHSLAGNFLIDKMHRQSDLEASVVLAIRMLSSHSTPLNFYQRDALHMIVDNLPRLSRMERVNTFFPALIVQLVTEPGDDERTISMPVIRQTIERIYKDNAVEVGKILINLMDSSREMKNPEELAILDLAHALQPEIAKLDPNQGTGLTLRLDLYSEIDTPRQREAEARSFEALEKLLKQASGKALSAKIWPISAAGSKKIAANLVFAPLIINPVSLATRMLHQAAHPDNRPFNRLRDFLTRLSPLLPPEDKVITSVILEKMEDGALRNAAHPLRQEMRRKAGFGILSAYYQVLVSSKYGHTQIDKPRLAGFMPPRIRKAVEVQPG